MLWLGGSVFWRSGQIGQLVRVIKLAQHQKTAGWSEKCLSSGQNQAIFTSASLPLGECRWKRHE
jgi:hypothetical protein